MPRLICNFVPKLMTRQKYTAMIRNIEIGDFELLKRFVSLTAEDVDMDHSAINFDDDGNIKAIVLTNSMPLIDSFPNHKFPRTRQCKSYFDNYKREKNHQIIFLYRADRNGFGLSATFTFLKNQNTPKGFDLWWVDAESELITKENLNKLCGLIHINNTSKYCGRI